MISVRLRLVGGGPGESGRPGEWTPDQSSSPNTADASLRTSTDRTAHTCAAVSSSPNRRQEWRVVARGSASYPADRRSTRHFLKPKPRRQRLRINVSVCKG